MKVEKVGVLGAGYWGKNHIRDYIEMGKKVKLCDTDPKKLKELKERHPEIEITEDYREILNDPEISAVSIVLPNHLHYEFAKKFLEAGKNTLLEKPMTLHSNEARELIDIANDKNIVLAVGHIFRYNGALRRLKEMLEGNELGDIYLAKLTWNNIEPVFEDRDVLFDLAVHPFDIVNYLFGVNPEWISCIGEGYRKEKGEEVAFVNAKLGKTVMHLEISWLTPRKTRELVVVGSKKTAFVDCLNQTLRIFDVNENKENEIEIDKTNALHEELHHFIECVEKGEKAISGGEVGYWIISILEYAQKSMREGKIITIK